MIGRRRMIAITAGAGLATALGPRARAVAPTVPLHRWTGIALGASASITIAHDDAPRLVALAQAEIERLEAIFSLYRTDSALSRLNAAGHLAAPPFEMLELLSLCDTLHGLTGAAFDPTIQPLWALYARRHAEGASPTAAEIEATRQLIGWGLVDVAPDAVVLKKPGAALSLNGIAQGYIADRVADLLRGQGVSDVLVDMGEIVALGHRPDGRPWNVGLADVADPERATSFRRLSNSAIATSAPLGTVFDRAGAVGHILDPRTGRPGGKWRQVSVIAPQAARADGLSTAFCLMEEVDIQRASAGVEVLLTA